MSGLVSVSWRRHCIYICQHNVWQNIFLKLAYLPEYFTRAHACAHVPAIWCSCMLLSWRVKIRCTFHVRSLHRLLLTCKRCLREYSCSKAEHLHCYICMPWGEHNVSIPHEGGFAKWNDWAPVPVLGSLPGSTNTSFTLMCDALDWNPQRFLQMSFPSV